LILFKRNLISSECLKCQSKFEKQDKLEKTGTNVVKTEQARKAWLAAKDDFDKTNRLLLLELPQFYEKRVDYFQPCLQALIRSQVSFNALKQNVSICTSVKIKENCGVGSKLFATFLLGFVMISIAG